MGIADEADRTLFVGNLDPQVTEELLFELFLQAGPLIKVKIPKDNDGRPKQFGFINFKHEISVPYGMNLLNGTRLFGRPLKIQFRAGSSHVSQEGHSPAGSQTPSPTNTATQRGGRYDRGAEQMGSPPYSPSRLMQRSFSSPDNLQRQAVMNTWQMQVNGSYPSYSSSSWQQEHPAPRGHRQSHQHEGSGYYGREARQSDLGSERHHRSQRSDYYHHDERGGGGGAGRNRDYSDRQREGSRDARWRRY